MPGGASPLPQHEEPVLLNAGPVPDFPLSPNDFSDPHIGTQQFVDHGRDVRLPGFRIPLNELLNFSIEVNGQPQSGVRPVKLPAGTLRQVIFRLQIAQSNTIRSWVNWVMMLEFEWHEYKSVSNHAKHGVSFNEARTVFNDPFALTQADPDHSLDEDRWLEMGLSANGRLLVVWYTLRVGVIRIIGARVATSAESTRYVDERS